MSVREGAIFFLKTNYLSLKRASCLFRAEISGGLGKAVHVHFHMRTNVPPLLPGLLHNSVDVGGGNLIKIRCYIRSHTLYTNFV